MNFELFRNKYDLYHFFGPAVLWLITLGFFAVAKTFFEYFLVSLIAVMVLLAPWGWEYWDQFKIMYNNPRTIDWTSFQRNLFTSDGISDKHDEYLGYLGIIISTTIFFGMYAIAGHFVPN